MDASENKPVILGYDGQTVTPEFAAAMRVVLVRLRNEALRQTEFGWAVNLSHAIATLHVMAEHIWGKNWRPTDDGQPVTVPFTPLIEPFRAILAQVADVIRPFARIKESDYSEGKDNDGYAAVRRRDYGADWQDFILADIKAAKDFVTWFDNGMNNPPIDLKKPRSDDEGFKFVE